MQLNQLRQNLEHIRVELLHAQAATEQHQQAALWTAMTAVCCCAPPVCHGALCHNAGQSLFCSAVLPQNCQTKTHHFTHTTCKTAKPKHTTTCKHANSWGLSTGSMFRECFHSSLLSTFDFCVKHQRPAPHHTHSTHSRQLTHTHTPQLDPSTARQQPAARMARATKSLGKGPCDQQGRQTALPPPLLCHGCTPPIPHAQPHQHPKP